MKDAANAKEAKMADLPDLDEQDRTPINMQREEDVQYWSQELTRKQLTAIDQDSGELRIGSPCRDKHLSRSGNLLPVF